MPEQLWPRLYELFHVVRELPPEARDKRITAECEGAPALERELRALLAIDETLPPSFLERAW
ncbi:MAG: hypothetical protein RKU31_15355 [Deltaproteobacteria bacterium]|jgi:hypothetical protein